MTKTYIDELAEEIARLRDYYDKAITRERETATKFNNAYWENQQLKELLKEWMHFYPIILYEHEDTLKTKDIVELYDKTREVLK